MRKIVKPTRLSQTIAAHTSVAQIELLSVSDRAGWVAASKVREVWAKILQLIEKPSPGWQMQVFFYVQELLNETHKELKKGLEGLAQGGMAAAGATLASSLPLRTLTGRHVEHVVVEEQLFEAVKKPRPVGFVIRKTMRAIEHPTKLPKPSKPLAKLSKSEEKQREQLRLMLWPPIGQRKVEELLKRPVFGKTWEQDLSDSTRADGFDATTLVHKLSLGFSQGKTPQEIARDIKPAVDGMSKTATRLARTYGMQISHAATREAHEQIGDLLIGYQIHAQLDRNTRIWHAARSGTIYYKNPDRSKGQKGYEQMPNPPLEADDPRERPAGEPKMAWH